MIIEDVVNTLFSDWYYCNTNKQVIFFRPLSHTVDTIKD